MNNNNNNNNNHKSFVDSFNNVSKNLAVRYTTNMHLDFINEFVKFADNTHDIILQNSVLEIIQRAECDILNIINEYERDNEENID